MDFKEKTIETVVVRIYVEENGIEIGRCFIYLIKNDLHEELYALERNW